jgi:hypothetical protein
VKQPGAEKLFKVLLTKQGNPGKENEVSRLFSDLT